MPISLSKPAVHAISSRIGEQLGLSTDYSFSPLSKIGNAEARKTSNFTARYLPSLVSAFTSIPIGSAYVPALAMVAPNPYFVKYVRKGYCKNLLKVQVAVLVKFPSPVEILRVYSNEFPRRLFFFSDKYLDLLGDWLQTAVNESKAIVKFKMASERDLEAFKASQALHGLAQQNMQNLRTRPALSKVIVTFHWVECGASGCGSPCHSNVLPDEHQQLHWEVHKAHCLHTRFGGKRELHERRVAAAANCSAV
ncbi:hypothetical protein R3P38DRAFT_2781640 [Favolaschia claudopus]|uniref:Uncharacterized protein n=1 Tax=Favolaschia claudopus TaxID=2862362 RepID=A0AAW0B4J9_9AGAR